MKSTNILISGASIAGPALAYWLWRYGFNPTVVERAPAPRPGGQAVDLRGAARGVIERMGIMAEVRRSRVDERGMAFVSASGKRVARMPAGAFGGEGIVSEIEILRGDLTRILYQATRDDTEYLFDDSIASLTQDDAGVRVTFERGAPRTFDLVVGADGVHSRVRALAFGEESAFIRPLGAYTAYFTIPNYLDTDGWFLLYNAPGGKVAAFRPEHQRSAKAMFSFASPPLRYDRGNIDQQKKILAETFAGVGWEVPRLLDAMWDAPDFYFEMYGQVRMDRWSNGRIALVGDAGYGPSPLTGLGTSLALVGAHVLAGELALAAGDHRVAFPGYERELRDYVNECQELPPGGIQGFLPRTRMAIWLRNQSLRLLTSRPWSGLLSRTFTKADSISLKDYDREAMLVEPGLAGRSSVG